ncbi:extracellular solute-binding protein [bacterium]|nr:MAG: extracellular solute-binding protein [bacterium]
MQTRKQITWTSGVLILGLLALLYLVPFYLIIQRPKPAVTEIFFADRITDAHRILIEKYNRMNAGKIKVTPIDFPNSDFSTNERKEILTRLLRGEGDGIDLMAVDVVWVQRFEKWCEPLGKYFSDQELKRIIPDALYSCRSEGELVAVPLDLVQGVLYYREDLLRNMKGGEGVIQALQGNMTWPEFVRLKEKLGWKKPFYVFTAADYEGLVCIYIEVLLSLRRDYFSTVGFDFDTPEGREALRLLVDLVQRDRASPEAVTTFTEVPSYEYFIKNDGLFIHGWNTFDKDFSDAPYDRAKEQHLRKAPIPYPAGGQPASVFGGWNLMISKFSKKKEAVVDFAKFLLSDESQEMFYTHGGYYPVVSSFYDNPESLQRHPEIAGIKELMRTGVHRPPRKDYTNYSKIMSHYFALAIRNKLSVEEATASVTRTIRSANISFTDR